MKRALIVDDDRRGRRVLQIILEQMSIEPTAVDSGEAALERLQAEKFDLILTDLRMAGLSGTELLREVRRRDADVPVIILTAYGTVESAVEAMKLGASDYILRPFDVEVVETAIRRSLELRSYRQENRYLREQVNEAAGTASFTIASPAMRDLAALIEKVAPTRAPVLVTGETGSGKELVARALHEQSPRAARLFVPINCAAIPADLLESELFGHTRGAFTGADVERAGKFEVADGGTLFLDEIGDMPQALQAKLLRVLQENVLERVGSNQRISVDVRVISSTHRDLAADLAAGRFREDLYYRLNVFHLHVPPLRERREDVLALAPLLLERFAAEIGQKPPRITADALEALTHHRWPGNVRELRNTMERAAVLGAGRDVDAAFVRSLLPASEKDALEEDHSDDDLTLEAALERLERRLILRALGTTGDNKARAARLLGVSERTLWYKLQKHGL